MVRTQEMNKNMISQRVLANRKYSMIQREHLKIPLIDKSSQYRVKVEEQNILQFHSNKTKQTEFFQTFRGTSVPKSLRSTVRPNHNSALENY